MLVDPTAGSIDFSKAIRLREVLFQFQEYSDVWVAMALETLTSKHTGFRKVKILMPFVETFCTPGNFRHTIGKETYDQWMDLDRVLIRLWESNAIHIQVTYCAEAEGGMACQYIGSLFPEMRERGLVEMVYDPDLF